MVLLCKTHSQRALNRGTGQVVLLITWAPHTSCISKENWRGVQDRSSFLSHGLLIQAAFPKRIEEGYRRSSFLSPGLLIQAAIPKRIEEGYRTGRPSYNMVTHTRLTPKENWRGVQTGRPSYYIVLSYQTNSQRELKRSTGQVIPSYDVVPSYNTHFLRELKRGTGQVILLITWSPLTSKVNRIGEKDRSFFLF